MDEDTDISLLTLALTYFLSLKKKKEKEKQAVVKAAFRLLATLASSCETLYLRQQKKENKIFNLFVA